MLPLLLLVLLMAFGLGWSLKAALSGRSRKLASAAGWILLVFPSTVLAILALKGQGPAAWYLGPAWLFSKWISIPLLILYLLGVPVRTAWRRARIYRDEANLLERSRILEPDRWPELGYQALADQLGVEPVPIHLSKDVATAYAIGVVSKAILLPAGWVPPEVRGQLDDYWFDVEDLPHGVDDIRAILAHELAHHRDSTGLRSLVLEMGGYLLPWEFVVGSRSAHGQDGTHMGISGRMLAALSRGISRVGRLVWRHALDAERRRQERVADEEAERVFPPSRYIIESFRGELYSHPAGQPGRAAQLAALAAAVAILLTGLTALPGRQAWSRLAGGESPLPWRLPVGWSVNENYPAHALEEVGFLPAADAKPPRIRLRFAGTEEPLDDALAVVTARNGFPSACMAPIPEGSTLRIEWPVTFKGKGDPWTLRGERTPLYAWIVQDRMTDPGLQGYLIRTQFGSYNGRFSVEPAVGGRVVLKAEWGWFPALPEGATSLLLGLGVQGDAPGTYDIEAPVVKLVTKEGAVRFLDPAGSGQFVSLGGS